MTYAELILDTVRPDYLQGLLLMPVPAQGCLFRYAVSYLANVPPAVPLPAALEAAWDRLQPRLDADCSGQASVRTALHPVAAGRLWYLQTLPDEQLGKLAMGFAGTLLNLPLELPAPASTQSTCLQSHFQQSAQALQGSLRDAARRTYKEVREAVETIAVPGQLMPDETDYLTGSLMLIHLCELGETANGSCELQDVHLLACLRGAYALLHGTKMEALDLNACRAEAQAQLAEAGILRPPTPAQDAAAPSAPPADPTRSEPEVPDLPRSDAAPPAKLTWDGGW